MGESTVVPNRDLHSLRLGAIDEIDDAISALTEAVRLCDEAADGIEHASDMAFRCSANRIRLELSKLRNTRELLVAAKNMVAG